MLRSFCFSVFCTDRRKSFESSHSSSRLSPKNGKGGSLGGSTDAVMRRKQSESDSSAKRRSGGRLSGSFRPLSSTSGSSSAGSDSEAEVEMRNLLTQSRQRLEHTEALRVRRHLLRPEDYVRMHCYRLRASSWTQLVCRYRKGKGTEEFSISWEDVNAAHECWDDGRSFFLGYLILLLLLTLYIRLHLLCFW